MKKTFGGWVEVQVEVGGSASASGRITEAGGGTHAKDLLGVLLDEVLDEAAEGVSSS